MKGKITDLGAEPVEDHGIYVSENATPILSNSKYEPLGSVSGKGVIQHQYSDLKKNTTYYTGLSLS